MAKNWKKIVRRNIVRPVAYGVVFRLYPDLAARYLLRKELAAIRKEADKFFASGAPLPEGASREDFYQAMNKHYVSISEYLHQYEFYRLTEEERDEFISRSLMRAVSCKLRMKYPNDFHGLPLQKDKFLARFTALGFCKRRWLYTPQCTYEQFADLLSSTECVIKPHDGSLGFGVKKVPAQTDPVQIKSLYDKCVQGSMIIEECLHGCDAIQAFHPQSLNTIRFVTVAFRGKAFPFGAFLRMGIGDMIIDNAHAGGLFAQINMETGVIESEGITTEGLRVERHPDTNMLIKGTQIPRWNEVVDFCVSAARQTKNTVSGWDVIITDKGTLEFIEANNRPDFDVMQSPLKIGVKRKVLDMLSEVVGKEMKIDGFTR